ncbi:type III glutamate--ammonia ligase [Catenuloplanes japonicus]|uniref:type III glutamate--ammonia ligase n=1 Tax=Catenuloplanes japonicus TaxID=33876 RepID=UPI00052511A5|nr:type III glutamate--ammonia ligase [Catenuloplanes japonicus]
MEALADLVKEHGTRFVLATFVDLDGKPCAKLVPVEAVDALATEGVGFAGYAAGALGQQPCDPDVMAIPDPSTFTPLPFLRPGLAMVHCDPHVEGAPWPFAPRVILASVITNLRSRGYAARVGAEVEYFLLDRDVSAGPRPADADDRAAQPCYDARGVTRMYDHLTEVSTAMNALGWGNYANDHEDANGQFEQNFTFADAMVTADRVVTARYLITMLAERRGMLATFMPKPFTDRTGNGLHLHVSLWDDADAALFPDKSDTRRLGLSPLAYRFVGGVLAHAPGLLSVLAPTVNSYKRRGALSTSSGATWAPNRAGYGGNDRTHLIRVPDGNRVEVRAGDGSANPYLAIAALLTAGLDGIDHGLDPGDPSGPGQHPSDAAELPVTLLHAIDALRADPVVRGALDAAGPGVADYFAARKRDEFLTWHNTVTPWETTRYLTAV